LPVICNSIYSLFDAELRTDAVTGLKRHQSAHRHSNQAFVIQALHRTCCSRPLRGGECHFECALQIAVDLVAAGVIDRSTAFERLSGVDLDALTRRCLRSGVEGTPIATGTPASLGVATRAIAFDSRRPVARVDIALIVGGTAEAITVKADASMAVSSQAVAAEVLPEEAVRTLPITSRNVYNFHLIGPGVKARPSTGFGTTAFYVGGAERMQWFTDALDNTSRNGGRQVRLVITTPENVEEMQLLTGGYTAEFGRAAGGVINVITRSGTNMSSGSLMRWIGRAASSRNPDHGPPRRS
jgi:outer membrane receptor protein involved in Fe transport